MSHHLLPVLLAWLIMFAATPAAPAAQPASPVAPAAAFPPEAYTAVGFSFAVNNRLPGLDWNEEQMEAFLAGMRAAFRGTPPEVDESAGRLQAEIIRRLQHIVATEKMSRTEYFADPERFEAYMKQACKTFKLERMDSGLAFGFVSPGGGSRPGPDDTVVISYKASAADGKTDLPQLGSDNRRVKVAELLPGLAEAVQMMATNSVALMVLPPDLSFGEGEWPAGVDRGAPLVFAVVLHEVVLAP